MIDEVSGIFRPQAVASRIFLANAAKEIRRPIALRGLAIGNGLTRPDVQ